MPLTNYSTITQVRYWLERMTVSLISDANVTIALDEAKKIIKTDLANVINFTAVDALSAVPYYIDVLSQYKANELVLVKKYGGERKDGSEDIIYWKTKYNDLIKMILSGAVVIVDNSGNSLSTGATVMDTMPLSGVEPYFGEGDYGEFLSATELATERSIT